MVRVEAGTNEALVEVVENLRDDDVREFLALAPYDSAEMLRGDLLCRYANRHDTYAAFDDDKAVAFGCLVEVSTEVMVAGFFATDRFAAIALPVARFIKRRLLPTFRDHSIRCGIIEDHVSAIGFVKVLGFRQVPGLYTVGKHGEVFCKFVWGG
jgi:hypothetical protein